MRESPRLRRLRSDHKALQELAAESSVFSFAGHGDPPELYVVRFAGRGFSRPNPEGDVIYQDLHEVHIRLGAAYPRMMPELAWKSPVFHPNISASGVVCLGGYGTYWVPSLTLDELCTMLWDMIRYENYDEKSPYNRDAANWVKNQIHFRLPIDPRPLRDRKAGYAQTVPMATARPAKPKPAATAPTSPFRPPPLPATSAIPPIRTQPVHAPRSAPAVTEPIEAEVIFIDTPPRPPVVPAQARDEGGIMFIE
jgi:ubiquitin-protein ligase